MRISGFLLLLLFIFPSCQETVVEQYGGFPEEIGEIFINSCATPGCHNDRSAPTAGKLSLESWESAFKGSSGGSSIIPFRSDMSFLDYFINTDSSLGTVLSPTMPFNQPPLDKNQVILIREWINQGAKNVHGLVKFEDNHRRKKIYVLNQGCDQVAVFDGETGLIMRYKDIGIEPNKIESPHILKLSTDQMYFYVVFLSENPYIEKYSTLDEKLVARIEIGYGDWNTIAITEDGKYGYAVDLAGQKVALANLETNTFLGEITFNENPHGSFISPDQSKLYLTKQFGSELYVLDISTPDNPQYSDPIDLIQGVPPTNNLALEPHEVAFDPTGDYYYVTCQNSNEVRIFNYENDSLIKVIPVGDYPLEMIFSKEHSLGFITCTEDQTNTLPGQRGSIAIINYQTQQLIKHVYVGHQPHGLDIDKSAGYLYVANRNVLPGGPAPHHSTSCNGTNGYLTRLDLSTLSLDPNYKQEVTVDPYSVAVREF